MLVDLAKLSRVVGGVSLATGLALATVIGSVLAQERPSVQQIIEALKPKHLTRSLDAGTAPVSASESNPDLPFINTVRNRTARSLTPPEREEMKRLTRDKPFIDLEINFEYGSAKLARSAMPKARDIGEALSSAQLKGNTFVVEGHTDAQGSTSYNQRLSDQRADAVKRFLVEQYKIPAPELITVGYGKSQLKNPDHPFAAENRRVRVVTLTANVANK